MLDTSSGKITFTVEEDGARLDVFVASHSLLSRNKVQEMLKEGMITLNGSPAKPSTKLDIGDVVEVVAPSPDIIELEPQDLSLKVVYQDSDLIVVDKPAGVPTHPAPGHPDRTLVNGILALRPDLRREEGNVRPGIVHRLDKDTSGLIVVAISDRAHASLSEQLQRRTMVKKYLALVEGTITPATGLVDAPIARDPRNRQRMAVVSNGREARTRYRVLEHIAGYTLVELTLETGRTHQIRVHLSAIGYPIVGDPVYGKKSKRSADLGCERQFLHSYILGFNRPSDNQYVEFKSEVPPDLQEVLDRLKAAVA